MDSKTLHCYEYLNFTILFNGINTTNSTISSTIATTEITTSTTAKMIPTTTLDKTTETSQTPVEKAHNGSKQEHSAYYV